MVLFTPQKLANATNQGFLFKEWLLHISPAYYWLLLFIYALPFLWKRMLQMVIKPQAKWVKKKKWPVGFLSVLLTSKACSKLVKKLPFAYSVCRYNSHTDNSLVKHVEVEFKWAICYSTPLTIWLCREGEENLEWAKECSIHGLATRPSLFINLKH